MVVAAAVAAVKTALDTATADSLSLFFPFLFFYFFYSMGVWGGKGSCQDKTRQEKKYTALFGDFVISICLFTCLIAYWKDNPGLYHLPRYIFSF